MNNFAISAMGGSGTKFFAELLNKSKKYTVLHEPKRSNGFQGWQTETQLKPIQEAFVDNYGEVNSFLIFQMRDLKVGKKGLILRKPSSLVKTWNDRRKGELPERFWHRNKMYLYIMDDLIRGGMGFHYFEILTASTDALQGFCDEYVGDVKVTDEMRRNKKNTKRTGDYEFKDWDKFNYHFKWFEDKYY